MSEPRRIPVSNGILTPQHVREIKAAIWTFLWFIDRTTEEYTSDRGERIGKVKGGIAFAEQEIAADLGISLRSVVRHIQDLEMRRYVRISRRPHGIVAEVRKSKKWILPRLEGESQAASSAPGSATSDTPEMSDHSPVIGQKRPITGESDRTEVSDHNGKCSDGNGRSRKGDSLLGTHRDSEESKTPPPRDRGRGKKNGPPARPAPVAASSDTPDESEEARPPTARQARGFALRVCQDHFRAEHQRLLGGKPPVLGVRQKAALNGLFDAIRETDGCDYEGAEGELKRAITAYLELNDPWLADHDYDPVYLSSRIGTIRKALEGRHTVATVAVRAEARPPVSDAELSKLFHRQQADRPRPHP